MEKEILLPEVLENKLVAEAIDYLQKCADPNINYKFDPEYFNKYIPGDFLGNYIKTAIDSIPKVAFNKKMEIANEYKKQFESYNLANRKNEIIDKFLILKAPLDFSNLKLVNDYRTYINGIIEIFQTHYSKFVNATEEIVEKNANTGTPYIDFSYKPNEYGKIIIDSLTKFTKIINKEPRGLTEQQITDYLESWFNKTVSLKMWHRTDFDVIGELERRQTSNDKMHAVIEHQSVLYKQYVKCLLNKYIDIFIKNPSKESRLEVAQSDLDLIGDYMKGDIDKIKKNRLYEVFSIYYKSDNVANFDNIQRSNYPDKNNKNIFSYNSYAQQEALYNYRNYLLDFINQSSKKEPAISEENKFIYTDYSIEELIKIFKELSNYIDHKQCTDINFISIFGKEISLKRKFNRIDWQNNKLRLFTFLFEVSSYKNKDGEKSLPNNVLNFLIPEYFLIKGKKIKTFSRPSKDEYENINTFKNIIKNALDKKE